MAEDKLSTRGLVEFDIGPLRRFTGILDSVPTEDQTFGEGDKARPVKRVSLNFKDIEVIEAVEPYHFPIATLVVSRSNKQKSRWGVLSDGTTKDRAIGFNNVADQQYTPDQLTLGSPVYIKPEARMDITDAIGKRLGMVVTDGADGRPEPMGLYDGRAGKDRPTPAWTVFSIEGVGIAGAQQGIKPTDIAIALLDGKSLADFNQAALANPLIRSDTALLQSISLPVTAPGSFSNALVKAGKFTKDAQGVYHKVG